MNTIHGADDTRRTAEGIVQKTQKGMSGIGDKVGTAAYDVAEEARRHVASAIEHASDSLRKFSNGSGEHGDGYIARLSDKLKTVGDALSSKDSLELAEDARGLAKKYQTPLIVAGLALAVLALRPMISKSR